MWGFTLLALCVSLLGRTSQAWATDGPRESPAQYSPAQDAPVIVGCWEELRSFATPFGEVVEYCRGHLQFQPEALDCYAFPERVCSVFRPAQQDWTTTRDRLPSRVLACPEAPEPPPCPRFGPGSGFGLRD